MASPYEHGSARIKVQVVATLLPLDVPVHVNSFWTLIKFSETQTISKVEDKILYYLNSLAKECPLDIVVHDRPITSSWTYLPVTLSSINKSTSLHEHNGLSNSSSVDSSPAVQELTILLKPRVCEYGNKKMTKPPRPIVMSCNISESLPKAVKLIFKKQLVFMQDSVLLGDSRSEILRDNDVVVINALCAFFTVGTEGGSKSSSHETDSFETEAELESFSRETMKDLNQNCLFFDTDEESDPAIEIELSPEIRTKFDTILKKIARLTYSHKYENRCAILNKKKSKKRKVCQDDNEIEKSNSINADSNKNDHQGKRQKKISAHEHLIEDHNEITVTNEVDILVSKSRKKSKKKRRSEIEVDNPFPVDTSFTHAADELIQKSQTGHHRNGREKDEVRGCPPVDMEVKVQSLSTSSTDITRKPADLLSLFVDLRNQQDNDDTHKTELITKETVKQIKDNATENTTINVSIPVKKSKKKKSSEIEVDTPDSTDTGFTHVTNEIVQKYQTSPHQNGRQEDKVQYCPPADMKVSLQLSNTRKTHKKRKPMDFGLSNLLCALRNQQAMEVNEDNDNTELINKETEKQANDNTTENTVEYVSTPDKQLDSSQATPKRKRVRKRKNKKSNVITSTSNSEIPESRERDYTLKLSEHHMPQNSRVTFECDSDDDEAQMNQTTSVAQSTPLLDQHEHFHTQNSVTEKCPLGEVNHTPAVETAKSDLAKASFNNAGAAIDPGEKFQALLNQCGRIGRQFETVSSNGGHAVIRGLRQRRKNYKSMADAVDPERDILTNVSIITKRVLGTEVSASSTSGYVEPNPSASGDDYDNLPSQHGHNKLATNHLNITHESKYVVPEVEASPVSVNYVLCQELHSLPLEGDIIAYKILELSEDYTPGLSNFKEAKVINVNVQTGTLLMEPRGRKDNKVRTGRFELTIDVTDNVNNEEDVSLVAVNLADLVDTRLVYRHVNKE